MTSSTTNLRDIFTSYEKKKQKQKMQKNETKNTLNIECQNSFPELIEKSFEKIRLMVKKVKKFYLFKDEIINEEYFKLT